MRAKDQRKGEGSRSIGLRKRERDRGRERERKNKKLIKNNKEIIFKWSGKKIRSFDIGCIIKWYVKCYKVGFLNVKY